MMHLPMEAQSGLTTIHSTTYAHKFQSSNLFGHQTNYTYDPKVIENALHININI